MSDTTHTTTTVDPQSPMPEPTRNPQDTVEQPPIANDDVQPIDYNVLGNPLPPKPKEEQPPKPDEVKPYDPTDPPKNADGMPLTADGHIMLDDDFAAIVRRGDDLGYTTRFEFNSLIDILQTTRGAPKRSDTVSGSSQGPTVGGGASTIGGASSVSGASFFDDGGAFTTHGGASTTSGASSSVDGSTHTTDTTLGSASSVSGASSVAADSVAGSGRPTESVSGASSVSGGAA